MTKTPHTAEFKRKVALEALREDKTLAQIASTHGVHPVQVSQWKKMLLEGAAAIFTNPKKARRAQVWDQEAHERKIGQMAIELDYLKKKLGQSA
jgi:transposase-like protein